ncbi:MAG: hypothetical protein AB1458_11705 [Bacteroidota bacterium]
MRKVIGIVLLLGCCLRSGAMTDSIVYSKDFEFAEGLYLSFSDFRNNHPVPKASIVSLYDKSAIDFFKKELQKTQIAFIDTSGKQITVYTHKLWGYSSSGNVYINYGVDFYKIQVIGSLCHFTAFVQIVLGGDPTLQNPYDMRDGYQMEQFMMDMETGKIAVFNYTNMQGFLKRDEELYKDYSALSKKKKKESAFIYLNKYNQRHPLYFPI